MLDAATTICGASVDEVRRVSMAALSIYALVVPLITLVIGLIMMAIPLLAASEATLVTTAWCELATTARPRTVSWFSVRSGAVSVGAWAVPRSKAWTSVPLFTD